MSVSSIYRRMAALASANRKFAVATVVRTQGSTPQVVGAKLVVPHLRPGDIIVTHSFVAHGTSDNTSDVRRDMLFQRRAAAPLWDPTTQMEARAEFMRESWSFFRRFKGTAAFP